MTFVRSPRPRFERANSEGAGRRGGLTVNPLPVVDSWVVLRDGRVIVARGSDYHIEWIGSNGKLIRSAVIPFAWEQLSMAAKAALVDSIRRTASRVIGSSGGDEVSLGFVPPDSLPSRKPPFAAGALQADMDDRLWIRTSTPPPNGTGSIYDVIANDGVLIGRVALEAHARILGFGGTRTVYVLVDGEWGSRIERRALPTFRTSEASHR